MPETPNYKFLENPAWHIRTSETGPNGCCPLYILTKEAPEEAIASYRAFLVAMAEDRTISEEEGDLRWLDFKAYYDQPIRG